MTRTHRWIAGIAALLLLLSALVLNFCFTFPARNAEFEAALQAFVDARRPGSEFTLFNGEDLAGWEVVGIGKWTVEDGILTARRGMGYLASRSHNLSDLVLTLEARINSNGNSGVFFRSRYPDNSLRPWPEGYEAQIDNHDSKNRTGSLYNRVRVTESLVQDDEWFTLKIRALGPSLQIYVNDALIVDATDAEHPQGFIALQAHDFLSRVDFRNIRLRIPEETAAPD